MPDPSVARIEEDTTEDVLLDGRVRLLQSRRGHRTGTDSVLLAVSVEPQAGDKVVDLGAGAGAVGLMIAARTSLAFELVLVERDPRLVALCEANVSGNGLTGRARAIAADILEAGALKRAGLLPGSADLVVTNPPFLEEGSGRPSPDSGRASARELPSGGFARWVAAAAELLKPRGRFALVQRADRLSACLGALDRRFGALQIRSIHPRAGDPANRIVITATKGSRAPLSILSPLVLHGPDGRFTAEAAVLHGSPGES
jgi:tRNA1(Val) A37 N6-methylase TrmN6